MVGWRLKATDELNCSFLASLSLSPRLSCSSLQVTLPFMLILWSIQPEENRFIIPAMDLLYSLILPPMVGLLLSRRRLYIHKQQQILEIPHTQDNTRRW